VHALQPDVHLHTFPALGPSWMRPLKHVKGARHTRPNVPRPVGTVPPGQPSAVMHAESARYRLLRHRAHVLVASKLSMPPRSLHRWQLLVSPAMRRQLHACSGISSSLYPLQVTCSEDIAECVRLTE